MPGYIAESIIAALKKSRKTLAKMRVLVMGLTYKENVAEYRESPVKDLIKELQNNKMEVLAYDILLTEEMIKNEFNAKPVRSLDELKKNKVDAVIITVAHTPFKQLELKDLQEIQEDMPVLIDIPGIFKTKNADKAGFYYKTL